MAKKKPVENINPALKSFVVPIGDLYADPKQLKDHFEEDIDAIAYSYRVFGQQKCIIVSQDDLNKVIAGTGQLKAAREVLKWTQIAVMAYGTEKGFLPASVDFSETGFAIADNRTGELSAWNKKSLKEHIKELKGESVIIKALGFSESDLSQMLQDPLKPGSWGAGATTQKKKGRDTAVIVGSYKFIIERDWYEKWIEDIRQAVGFDGDSIVAELKKRLTKKQITQFEKAMVVQDLKRRLEL